MAKYEQDTEMKSRELQDLKVCFKQYNEGAPIIMSDCSTTRRRY